MLPLWARVNRGAMAIKRVLTIRLFSVIYRILVGESPTPLQRCILLSVYSIAPADCATNSYLFPVGFTGRHKALSFLGGREGCGLALTMFLLRGPS